MVRIEMYSRVEGVPDNDPMVVETKEGIKVRSNPNTCEVWKKRALEIYNTILKGTFEEKVKLLKEHNNGWDYICYKEPHFYVFLFED